MKSPAIESATGSASVAIEITSAAMPEKASLSAVFIASVTIVTPAAYTTIAFVLLSFILYIKQAFDLIDAVCEY